MQYQVWLEAAGPSTGTEGRNTTETKLLGTYEAATFQDAVSMAAKAKGLSDRYLHYNSSTKEFTYWGCRFHSSEAEARKAWG